MDATNALPTLVPPYGAMPPTFWEQHGMAVLAGAFVFLAMAGGLAWRILKPRPQPVLPPAIVAREVLVQCRARPEDKRVLGEVSRAFRRYLGAVLGLPGGEQTTAELRGELESLGGAGAPPYRGERTTAELCGELERSGKLTPELTRAISDFLRTCDERKFSASVSSAPLAGAGRALEFIDRIEEALRAQDAGVNKK